MTTERRVTIDNETVKVVKSTLTLQDRSSYHRGSQGNVGKLLAIEISKPDDQKNLEHCLNPQQVMELQKRLKEWLDTGHRQGFYVKESGK